MTTTVVRRLGRDTLYVVAGLPLAVLSFSLVVTGLAASLGLLITLLGIPLAVGTLLMARGFAVVERARLQLLDGRPLLPAGHRRPGRGGWRGLLARLKDPQSWLDVLHAVVGFPVAVLTSVVAVTWWAVTLGGLTYWFWQTFLPDDGDDGLARLLGWEQPWADSVLNLAVGLLFALTLVPVLRGCAALQAGLARLLVANPQLASLRQEVDALTVSRAAVVEAGTSTLRRLERDLHDGPQQRLVRLQMDLATVRRRLADDPSVADDLVGEAEQQVTETLQELRALSRGIAPPVLSDRGLPSALASLAGRCTVQVGLDVALPDVERLPEPVEETAYFVVAESLTNVAKHSAARSCRVSVRREHDPLAGGGGEVVVVEVADDGRGGAHPAKGHGLAGLVDRVAGVDGRLEVDSPDGGPTRVVAVLPCG
ncbi:sensor histidine kinase [Aquipuribacter sp. MA13-6]|uniref:sensor histidine kinase n=1 Tax=unclassified Aquipuribacter TaxID=2635084 RepID=UPI003EE87C2A